MVRLNLCLKALLRKEPRQECCRVSSTWRSFPLTTTSCTEGGGAYLEHWNSRAFYLKNVLGYPLTCWCFVSLYMIKVTSAVFGSVSAGSAVRGQEARVLKRRSCLWGDDERTLAWVWLKLLSLWFGPFNDFCRWSYWTVFLIKQEMCAHVWLHTASLSEFHLNRCCWWPVQAFTQGTHRH